jgi:hypothetical protein
MAMTQLVHDMESIHKSCCLFMSKFALWPFENFSRRATFIAVVRIISRVWNRKETDSREFEIWQKRQVN